MRVPAQFQVLSFVPLSLCCFKPWFVSIYPSLSILAQHIGISVLSSSEHLDSSSRTWFVDRRWRCVDWDCWSDLDSIGRRRTLWWRELVFGGWNRGDLWEMAWNGPEWSRDTRNCDECVYWIFIEGIDDKKWYIGFVNMLCWGSLDNSKRDCVWNKKMCFQFGYWFIECVTTANVSAVVVLLIGVFSRNCLAEIGICGLGCWKLILLIL